MGNLNRCVNAFKNPEVKQCDILIETGTSRGDSVLWALGNLKVEKIYSVEIIPKIAEAARKRVNSDKVDIREGLSYDFLNVLLDEIDKSKRILFWLDAHFPEDNKQHERDKKWPLIPEIRLIAEKRKGCKDIILCDDLRIYEDTMPKALQGQERFWARYPTDSDWKSFLSEMKDQYRIDKSMQDEGYVSFHAK